MRMFSKLLVYRVGGQNWSYHDSSFVIYDLASRSSNQVQDHLYSVSEQQREREVPEILQNIINFLPSKYYSLT